MTTDTDTDETTADASDEKSPDPSEVSEAGPAVAKSVGRPADAWSPDVVPAPLEPLMRRADALDDETFRRIVAAHHETDHDLVPPLIDMVRSSYLWDDQAPGNGFAPIEAARLLAAIGDDRAIVPLYHVLAATDPETLLDTAVTEALQAFGERAINPGIRVLKQLGEDFREDLACVIAGIDTDRDVAFQVLVKHFVQNPHLGAINLAEFGDPRGIDAIEPVLERYMVAAVDDPDEADVILDLVDAFEELGGELSPAHQADIEDLREQRNWGKNLIEDIKQGNDSPDHDHPDTHVNERDVGRNDPCWCGSGRKYKHCHLDEDRRRDS